MGHLIIGCLIGLGIAKTPEDMAMIMFASLLPDIDTPTSTYGRFNPLARWGWMEHRGFTHSILGCVALALPFYWLFGSHMFKLVLIGCWGHVFGDWLIGKLPSKQRLELRIW